MFERTSTDDERRLRRHLRRDATSWSQPAPPALRSNTMRHVAAVNPNDGALPIPPARWRRAAARVAACAILALTAFFALIAQPINPPAPVTDTTPNLRRLRQTVNEHAHRVEDLLLASSLHREINAVAADVRLLARLVGADQSAPDALDTDRRQ